MWLNLHPLSIYFFQCDSDLENPANKFFHFGQTREHLLAPSSEKPGNNICYVIIF